MKERKETKCVPGCEHYVHELSAPNIFVSRDVPLLLFFIFLIFYFYFGDTSIVSIVSDSSIVASVSCVILASIVCSSKVIL